MQTEALQSALLAHSVDEIMECNRISQLKHHFVQCARAIMSFIQLRDRVNRRRGKAGSVLAAITTASRKLGHQRRTFPRRNFHDNYYSPQCQNIESNICHIRTCLYSTSSFRSLLLWIASSWGREGQRMPPSETLLTQKCSHHSHKPHTLFLPPWSYPYCYQNPIMIG